MHIGIDGNLLCGKKTGMGMVVSSILKNWEEDATIELTLFVPGDLDLDFTRQLNEKRIRIVNCGAVNYFKWEQIILPKMAETYHIDVLWCPYNTAPLKTHCPIVVTVHDVIYMSIKLNTIHSLYKKLGAIYRKLVVPRAVKKAKKIITISNYAKNDICKWFPDAEKKIKVIYNSTDISELSLNEAEKTNFFLENGIRKPYILGFGSLESRKNTMGLIEAYNMLDTKTKEEYQLVLFGFRGFEESNEYKYIKDNHIKNIIVLPYISEKEKNTLYRNSTTFVFPSLSEGFGIPILEAYYNETPVITSNVTAIPEVAGDAAILVNPMNLVELSKEIKNVIFDSEKQIEMKTKGKRRLKDFSWQKAARDVMKLLKSSVE